MTADAPDYGRLVNALRGMIELFEQIDGGEHDDAPELTAARRAIDRSWAEGETACVVGEVFSERRRQIEHEGFNAEHDDAVNYRGQLVFASIAYQTNAVVSGVMIGGGASHTKIASVAAGAPAPGTWPWRKVWWKPSGVRRDLIKSCALTVAEIERLDRRAEDEE